MAKKILVIEDDKLILELLGNKLKDYEYKVLVDNGIEKAKEFLPDLIILDIEQKGINILREISQDIVLKRIPVIIISNSGEPAEILEIQKLGARDWIVKEEFDLDELIDKVIKQIGKS